MAEKMTYVHVSTHDGAQTRIPFDPEARQPDYRKAADGSLTSTLHELYVRDCDEQPGDSWIEDPDGGYAYPPKALRGDAAAERRPQGDTA